MLAPVTNFSPLAYFMFVHYRLVLVVEHSIYYSLGVTHSHTQGWDELDLTVEGCLWSAISLN